MKLYGSEVEWGGVGIVYLISLLDTIYLLPTF
jgi:hypothetical protein